MLKRTLVFSSPMHLSLRNAQLVVSTKEATNEQRTVPIEHYRQTIFQHRKYLG